MTSARTRYKDQARTYRAQLRTLKAISARFNTRSSNVPLEQAISERREALRNLGRTPAPAGFDRPAEYNPGLMLTLRKDRARRLRIARNEIIRRANELISDRENGYDFKIQYSVPTPALAREIMNLLRRTAL